MFIDKKIWVVGNLSKEELKIAKGGPRDRSYIVAVITLMMALGVLEVAGYIFKPEIGALPLIVLWAGLALALGRFVAIDFRQGRKYSQVMNGRKVHQVKDDDPFDRLMYEVDDDRDFLNRHSITVDILLERASVWEAWKRLCEHPNLSDEEKGYLNELINSDVRDIVRMMRDLEAAPLSS